MTHPTGQKPAGCPIFHEPREPHAGELTYNEYLKVPELIALQQPQSQPAHHDEMLFIVIHQAYELWFKLMLHEVDQAASHLRAGEVLRARHFLARVVAIQKLLVDQIHILETMSPVDFLQFRDRLTPASGFQSAQFREFEFAAGVRDERYLAYFKDHPEFRVRLESRLKAPSLRGEFYSMLRAQGFAIPDDAERREDAGDSSVCDAILKALVPIYQNPDQHLPLYLMTECLVELDEYLALWREHHVRVVERVIGYKQGTGGSSGVDYLRSTTAKKAFPLLWEVRTRLEK